jgi:histidine triad (HIT) family protein
MPKPCVFCQILAGEKPAEFVYQDGEVAAFLDENPLFPGHVLVIPRTHRETLGDLFPNELLAVTTVTRLLSLAVPRALGADGSFVANNNRVSQSIPHLHLHVVPRRRKDGLKGFFWPRQGYRDDTHSAESAAAITQALLQEEILDFWFGPLVEGYASELFAARWFIPDPAFDSLIAFRYGAMRQRALAGELNWTDSRGRLAQIILLDQFTRNMFRSDARCFEADARALELCLAGLADDEQLSCDERAFLYLPLEHSEDPTHQALSVEKFTALAEVFPCERTRGYLAFAKEHADAIARFGRFPTRNQVLGRENTPEESAYLQP